MAATCAAAGWKALGGRRARGREAKRRPVGGPNVNRSDAPNRSSERRGRHHHSSRQWRHEVEVPLTDVRRLEGADVVMIPVVDRRTVVIDRVC